MFVSPAEPEKLRRNRKVSTLCEQRGADFLFIAHGQWIGIQRKEVKDLLASVQDGRLQKELAQLQECAYRVLIVEGKVKWTTEGEMVTDGYGRPWTKRQWWGVLWGVRAKGIWVEFTDSTDDTIKCLDAIELWFSKERHNSLDRRPGPVSLWGRPSNEEYQRHLVMGLPGVGPELADRIVREFKGVPFGWKVEKEDLMRVDGIGKKKAETIYATLEALETPEAGKD